MQLQVLLRALEANLLLGLLHLLLHALETNMLLGLHLLLHLLQLLLLHARMPCLEGKLLLGVHPWLHLLLLLHALEEKLKPKARNISQSPCDSLQVRVILFKCV